MIRDTRPWLDLEVKAYLFNFCHLMYHRLLMCEYILIILFDRGNLHWQNNVKYIFYIFLCRMFSLCICLLLSRGCQYLLRHGHCIDSIHEDLQASTRWVYERGKIHVTLLAFVRCSFQYFLLYVLHNLWIKVLV